MKRRVALGGRASRTLRSLMEPSVIQDLTNPSFVAQFLFRFVVFAEVRRCRALRQPAYNLREEGL